VISRDVIISLGSLVLYLHDGRLQIAPSLAGKTATLCQFLSLVLTLVVQITGAWETPWFWLLIATAVLTVASGVQYLWRGLAHAGTGPAA
jgi:phosphatidylglycerophosphate synthase